MARSAALLPQPLAVARPVPGDARRDHEAVLGAADRRLQQFRQVARAVTLEQPGPGVDRTRHGDAVRGAVELAHPQLAQPLDRRSGRGPPGAVERDHAARRRREQDEAVAPDPGHRRLDHALHGDRGDGRVHRVAAGAQDVERGQRRQRMEVAAMPFSAQATERPGSSKSRMRDASRKNQRGRILVPWRMALAQNRAAFHFS